MGLFGLFKPAWNSKDPERRMKAVAAIKVDRTVKGIQRLVNVVENAAYEDVRQQALMRLAIENKVYDVGFDVVSKITDEEILAKVAMNGSYRETCFEALRKISKPQLLAQIAVSEIEGDARDTQYYRETGKMRARVDRALREVIIAAIARITDQNVLVRVALEDRWAPTRQAAIEAVTDQSVLEKVAFHDAAVEVRGSAIARLTDKALARQAFHELFCDGSLSDKKSDLLNLALRWASLYPEVIAQNWPKIRDAANKVHVDRWEKTGSSDCHNDSSGHTDSYGRNYLDRFPPYVKS